MLRRTVCGDRGGNVETSQFTPCLSYPRGKGMAHQSACTDQWCRGYLHKVEQVLYL